MPGSYQVSPVTVTAVSAAELLGLGDPVLRSGPPRRARIGGMHVIQHWPSDVDYEIESVGFSGQQRP